MWLFLLAAHWLATISIVIKEQTILFHGVSCLFLLLFLVLIRGISQQSERHVKIIKTNGCQCFMISPDLAKPSCLDWQKFKNLSSWTLMAMTSEWNASNMLCRGSHCSLFGEANCVWAFVTLQSQFHIQIVSVLVGQLHVVSTLCAQRPMTNVEVVQKIAVGSTAGVPWGAGVHLWVAWSVA